jgi:hypothetical protein
MNKMWCYALLISMILPQSNGLNHCLATPNDAHNDTLGSRMYRYFGSRSLLSSGRKPAAGVAVGDLCVFFASVYGSPTDINNGQRYVDRFNLSVDLSWIIDSLTKPVPAYHQWWYVACVLHIRSS